MRVLPKEMVGATVRTERWYHIMDLANKQVEPSGPDPPQMLKFIMQQNRRFYIRKEDSATWREKLKINVCIRGR